MADENEEDENTFRILVATDCHVGFLEKDPIRGRDSFNSFEEVLQHAQTLKVDFILLGGDLFHDNKPSRRTIYRVMELIRMYCFGDNPVSIQILSDQTLNFPNKFGRVNYEDPNYNVSIPIFSIHGNHDDPAGDGGLSALDILSIGNLINYFGKSSNVDDITIYPILLSKGTSKLALYGLGNIRDERLYRTFQQKKVKLMRPIESREDWFNLLVLHQNRVAHSPKDHVHESMLDNFINFVIWGHEHECKIEPQQSCEGRFYISQPGSSICTALSESEAVKKHCGLLEIRKSVCRMTAIELKTVRPFVMEDVVLASEGLDADDMDLVVNFLANKVDEMIQRAIKDISSPNTPKEPLIRLRVEHTGFDTISKEKFGQRFVKRVANPNDILLFHKKKKSTGRVKVSGKQEEDAFLARATESMDHTSFEDMINSFLTQNLEILPENKLHEAVHRFVEKEEKSSITDFVEATLKLMQKNLISQDPTKSSKPEEIEEIVAKETSNMRTLYNIRQGDDQDKSQDADESLTTIAFDADEKIPTKSAKAPKKSTNATKKKTTKKTTVGQKSKKKNPSQKNPKASAAALKKKTPAKSNDVNRYSLQIVKQEKDLIGSSRKRKKSDSDVDLLDEKPKIKKKKTNSLLDDETPSIVHPKTENKSLTKLWGQRKK